MDQNQNNNLFNFDNPPPQEPQPPQEPATGPEEPTIFSGGAKVYEVPPASQGEVPPPPSYNPPPPPAYNPPPQVATQPPRNNRTIWIIVIVAVVLLCCCCLAIAAVWLYNNGDRILEQFNSVVPGMLSLLA